MKIRIPAPERPDYPDDRPAKPLNTCGCSGALQTSKPCTHSTSGGSR